MVSTENECAMRLGSKPTLAEETHPSVTLSEFFMAAHGHPLEVALLKLSRMAAVYTNIEWLQHTCQATWSHGQVCSKVSQPVC